MTTTCPNCGKPVRLGAKFCGNCGATMPSAPPPPRSTAAPAAPVASADAPVCPHCGKPVRAGARFCQVCGKEVIPAAPLPVAAPAVSAAEKPSSTTEKPSSTAPVQPAPASPPPPRSSGSRSLWIGISLVLLLVIVLGAGAGIYLLKPWELLAAATGTPTLVPPSVTLPPPAQPTNTPVPPTDTPPVPTSTFLPATPTQEVTIPVISPTLTVPVTPSIPLITPEMTATAVISGTAQASRLEDNFNTGDLNQNWLIWGSPLPKVTGGSDLALQLMGNAPGTSGVTSKTRMVIQPGLSFQYDVRLEGTVSQYAVAMDWDPRENFLIASSRPGVLNLLVGNGVVRFKVLGEQCDPVKIEDGGISMHHMRIDVALGLNFALFLDGAPVCTIQNVSLPQNDGNISFSGRGWVDNVLIGVP